jgi:bifunctional DNA-binding transcriptional regulator/antitoxin component of YhaV-PrlF toxin-antitoxin module
MNKFVPASFRPRLDTKTGRVWAIADRITKEKGRRASRTEVMSAFAAEGGNSNTASTQYSHWKADYDSRSTQSTPTESQSSSRFMLHIGSDGRLLLPLELRSQMQIGEDGRVSARIEDGELRLMSSKLALMRLQQIVREQDRGGGSVVDELIVERRAESQNG